MKVVLTVKKTVRDEAGKHILYVIDYLDMKFTFTANNNKVIKFFCGFRQEDRSYVQMRDYNHSWYFAVDRNYAALEIDKKMEMHHISQVARYIKGLYGFEEVTWFIEDQFHKQLEEWLGA